MLRLVVLGPRFRGDERLSFSASTPEHASAAFAHSCATCRRAKALVDLISRCSGCCAGPIAAPAWASCSEEAIVRPADPLAQPFAADGGPAGTAPASRNPEPVN